jgi:hypothetical protein
MFTHTGTITDAHGITHTDPVFVIQNCSHSCNQNISGHYDYDKCDNNFNTDENQWANYTVVFWTNEAAEVDGKLPLNFANADRSTNYNFQPDSAIKTGEELIAACEAHFKAEVLPEYEVE